MTSETWTAVATVVIALFTIMLAIIGGVQAWLTRRTIDLARDEFISTHRPRITVRRVSIGAIKGVGIPDILNVEFIVANIGDTKAKIIEMSTAIWFPGSAENLPAIPPYGECNYPGITFESGESGPMTHNDSTGMLMRFQSEIEAAKILDVGQKVGIARSFIDNGPSLLLSVTSYMRMTAKGNVALHFAESTTS